MLVQMIKNTEFINLILQLYFIFFSFQYNNWALGIFETNSIDFGPTYNS